MVSGSGKQVSLHYHSLEGITRAHSFWNTKMAAATSTHRKLNSTDFFETYVMSGIILCPGEHSRLMKTNSCSSLPTWGKSHPVHDAVTNKRGGYHEHWHLFIMLENQLRVITKSHSDIKLVSIFPYTMFQ